MESGRGRRVLGIAALGALLLAVWCVREWCIELPSERPTESTSSAQPGSRSSVDTASPRVVEVESVSPNVERESRDRQDRSLTGRVVDREGEPLSGARVEAYFQLTPPQDLELGSCEVEEPRVFSSVVSDSAGRFAIHELPWCGQVHFIVALPGFLRFDSRESPKSLTAEPTRDVGDLVLDRALSVSIRVIDGQQRPIEGAVVSSFLSPDRSTARTDANGQCVLDRLAAGEHSFLAQADGFEPSFAEPKGVELRVDGTAYAFTIVLESILEVRGTVVDQLGTPIVGAAVVAGMTVYDNRGEISRDEWIEIDRTQSGVDGSFTLRAACRGLTSVVARSGCDASKYETRNQTAWGASPVRLVIDRSRWLEVEVVDHETGQRVVPDWLLVFGAKRGASNRWIISDAGAEQIATAISEDRLIRATWGEILIDDLDGYGVAVEVVGYLDGRSDLLPFPIVNGQRIRVDVHRGRVVSGTTIPGAEVTCIQAPRGARYGRVVLADAAGRFRFERTTLRECELRARMPDSDPIVRTIPEDPKGADVEIDLR